MLAERFRLAFSQEAAGAWIEIPSKAGNDGTGGMTEGAGDHKGRPYSSAAARFLATLGMTGLGE